MYAQTIHSPLGELTAIADDTHLLLLSFSDSKKLETQKRKLTAKATKELIQQASKPITMIKKELDLYFAKQLTQFKTPLKLIGTKFQQKAWQALQKIPYGETRSYLQEAQTIGKPTAYRAVANANGANPLVIIVPCHRIIAHNGKLGGYSAGLTRKRYLLDHEAT